MGEEGGSVTLLCLTASSGVPLFCRSMGAPSKHQLPFPVIGSLNGVHMFGANLDVLLTAACTTNTHVVWRVFHNSITLIVLSSEEGASDFALGRLLDNAFSAMVLILGLEELVNVRNIERLKKDLRACYKLIDSFLAPLERSGDLTQCVECVPVPHGAALQECLEAFAGAAESRFGCLLAGGQLALATELWWQLAPQELLLLSWLVASLPPHTARDYPIYLPHGSPTVPHRLLTCQLLPGLEACLICGPSPALHTVENEVPVDPSGAEKQSELSATPRIGGGGPVPQVPRPRPAPLLRPGRHPLLPLGGQPSPPTGAFPGRLPTPRPPLLRGERHTQGLRHPCPPAPAVPAPGASRAHLRPAPPGRPHPAAPHRGHCLLRRWPGRRRVSSGCSVGLSCVQKTGSDQWPIQLCVQPTAARCPRGHEQNKGGSLDNRVTHPRRLTNTG
ncbi:protein fuzzy homolog isoform X2 [Dermochelys coriacea]|uniref:protein fuzzy homolog isoform X2 n=1 Tax=Dermochelys coriacea TaxID=27794 RepID=UPI0018E73D6F|nr:protein fuzzy homolog isoform X2 [Dermochelys coriacea]